MREAYADYTSSATTYKSLMNTQNMLDSQGLNAGAKVTAEDAQDKMIAGFEAQALQCNQHRKLLQILWIEFRMILMTVKKDLVMLNIMKLVSASGLDERTSEKVLSLFNGGVE